MSDSFDLQRFVNAQDHVYDQVLSELRAGAKRTHWMWYIFPQIRGLGSSPTAQFYALQSKEEAIAYDQHDVLGPRLRECTELVLQIEDRTIKEIFYFPDHMKFRSCMTLFDHVLEESDLFRQALDKYFDGELDRRTLSILAEE